MNAPPGRATCHAGGASMPKPWMPGTAPARQQPCRAAVAEGPACRLDGHCAAGASPSPHYDLPLARSSSCTATRRHFEDVAAPLPARWPTAASPDTGHQSAAAAGPGSAAAGCWSRPCTRWLEEVLPQLVEDRRKISFKRQVIQRNSDTFDSKTMYPKAQQSS